MSKPIVSTDSKQSTKGKPNPNQHQDYDNVLKKTFMRIYKSLISRLLGLDFNNTVKLPTTFSRTKEKRPDFAAKVKEVGKKEEIVHVEFQSRNDENMDKRELGYYNDFLWEYGLEVVQYVIYLGTGTPTMKTEMNYRNLKFSYTIICMNEQDVNTFLDSDNPHEIILAVLCKYDKKDAPKIIKKILAKLNQKAKNERQLFEYTTDLEILSGLRKLQSVTKKQVDKMPILYDLTKDLRYKEGKEVGKLEGKLEGELLKARTAIIEILKDKTLDMSVEKLTLIFNVTPKFVKDIQEELKKNPNLK